MEGTGAWPLVNRLLVISALMLVTPSWGLTCPPRDANNPGPALEEIAYYSDVVVMGKVTERFAQEGQGSDVYSVEMEVYCVYKGKDVTARITIVDAGSPPNQCFNSTFNVGESYMAYLKKHSDGRLTPAFPQHPEGYKDEMIFICDITISLPVDLKELPKGVKCEDKPPEYDYGYDYDYGKEGDQNATCFSYTPKEGSDSTYKTEKTQDDGENDASGNRPQTLVFLLLALVHSAVFFVIS